MADGSDAAIAVTVFGRAFVKATLRRDAEKHFNVGFRHDSTTGSTYIRTIHPSDVHDERSKLRANDCVVKINDTPVRAYNGRGVLLAEVQNLVASSGETLLLLIERRPQPLVDEDNFNSMGDDSCESDVSDDGGESEEEADCFCIYCGEEHPDNPRNGGDYGDYTPDDYGWDVYFCLPAQGICDDCLHKLQTKKDAIEPWYEYSGPADGSYFDDDDEEN